MNGIARRRIATVLVLAALSTACSGGGGGKEPSDDASTPANPQARSISEIRPGQVRVKVTGAETFTWEGRQDLRYVRTGVQGGPVNLLSLGIEAPIRTDDALLRFRWAFDLLNEYADKPGTFTLHSDKEASGDLRSLAFLIVLKVKESARDKEAVEDWEEVEYLKEFRKMEQSCTLEIGEAEQTGTLQCPEMANEDGEKVAYEISWEFDA